MLLDDIKTQQIDDWLLELSGTLKRGTLVSRQQIIAHVLKYAHDREMIRINPLALRPVKIPGKQQKQIDVPTAYDMDVIYNRVIHGPRPANLFS